VSGNRNIFRKTRNKTRQPCQETARRANHHTAAKSKLRSCPGRGAAFFTLLRRAGTYLNARTVDPGSAAHHAAEERRAAQHPGNLVMADSLDPVAVEIPEESP
jgi:hypothetical protein